jgi:hypothetical protein
MRIGHRDLAGIMAQNHRRKERWSPIKQRAADHLSDVEVLGGPVGGTEG